MYSECAKSIEKSTFLKGKELKEVVRFSATRVRPSEIENFSWVCKMTCYGQILAIRGILSIQNHAYCIQ